MEALSVVTPADEPGSSARKSLRAKGLSHRRRGAAGCRHKAGMTEKPNAPQKSAVGAGEMIAGPLLQEILASGSENATGELRHAGNDLLSQRLEILVGQRALDRLDLHFDRYRLLAFTE